MSQLSSRSWSVYTLFRPTGRANRLRPDEVTPRGMVRRLHAMKREGLWPVWDSEDVVKALGYQLAVRWEPDLLDVLAAVDTFLGQHEPLQQPAFQQALVQAIVGNPRLWPGLLGMAGPAWTWEVPEPFQPIPESPSAVVRPGWLALVERCVNHGMPVTADTLPAWRSYLHACRLSPDPDDLERLVRLATREPGLMGLTGKGHAYPLILAPTRNDARDRRLLGAYEQAGGDLAQPVWPHVSRQAGHLADPHLPAFVNHPLPLWSALALWGHVPAREWGQIRAAPEAWMSHLHLEERQRWARGAERGARLHPDLRRVRARHADRLDERILIHLETSLAWTTPSSVRRATTDRVGDTHPVWAAANLIPSVLVAPGGVLAQMWATRRDLREATDHEGANLWWALAQASRFTSDVDTVAARLLATPQVPCRPNVRGEGLLVWADSPVDALRTFTPFASDSDLAVQAATHPLIVAAGRWPSGVFGSTRSGMEATAVAMWSNMNALMADWQPGQSAPEVSGWTSWERTMAAWALIQRAPAAAMATTWGAVFFAVGALASLHDPAVAAAVDQWLSGRTAPFPDAVTQQPLFRLAVQHLDATPALVARLRHLSAHPAAPTMGQHRTRQRV